MFFSSFYHYGDSIVPKQYTQSEPNADDYELKIHLEVFIERQCHSLFIQTWFFLLISLYSVFMSGYFEFCIYVWSPDLVFRVKLGNGYKVSNRAEHISPEFKDSTTTETKWYKKLSWPFLSFGQPDLAEVVVFSVWTCSVKYYCGLCLLPVDWTVGKPADLPGTQQEMCCLWMDDNTISKWHGIGGIQTGLCKFTKSLSFFLQSHLFNICKTN